VGKNLVGRKSRRAHRFATSNCDFAPDLSRAAGMAFTQDHPEPTVRIATHRRRGHIHGAAQTRRDLPQKGCHILGAPRFSPHRSQALPIPGLSVSARAGRTSVTALQRCAKKNLPLRNCKPGRHRIYWWFDFEVCP
jgi:hypothetical protein